MARKMVTILDVVEKGLGGIGKRRISPEDVKNISMGVRKGFEDYASQIRSLQDEVKALKSEMCKGFSEVYGRLCNLEKEKKDGSKGTSPK